MENEDSFEIFDKYFIFKMGSSKLMNYSIDMC
jgi:hypothetical protein